MASKEELSEQLKLTQQMNAVVQAMASNLDRIASTYETQIDAVERLTKTLNDLKDVDLSKVTDKDIFKDFTKNLNTTKDDVVVFTKKMKDLGEHFQKKFPKSLPATIGALSGFSQGIKNVLSFGKGLTGFFAGIVEGAGSVALSIIAIPFKMFNALIDTAAKSAGGMDELAQALENLRKEMGDLKGPGTHAVLEASNNLKGFSDTGLSAWRVFGTLAERIELVTKVAVGMGSTFGVLKDEFADNGGALLAFQKGLGFSEEGMKALGDRAITMGESMSKSFLDISKQTLALGKAFDIDQKLIGKDMQKAAMDVKHFGAVTVKEIGQASVYARKLGLELDKITGTLDAFETLDSAAENAAKLGQAFGVNIDAFKMMEAQNPAEALDMLRKSFRDAGVDASKFSRQQAKLLSQSIGLDEATVRQAFSAKNYGTSLDDIKKKSENAEKKTMTQAEAMAKLSDSIERMVKSGGAMEGGFWQQFLKGFLGGIQASKEFRDIMMNIRRALMITYQEGVRLGKAFVEMFPGVKQFLGGIAEFFQPEKFKKLVGGVVDIFKDWMKNLTDPNGKASFGGLMDKLKAKFFDFFDGQSGAGKKMLDGFKSMMKVMGSVVAEGIKWIAQQATQGIRFIVDLLNGKVNLSGAKGAAGGGLGFLMDILGPIVDSLKDAWKTLAPALWDLAKTIFTKLKEFLTSDQVTSLIKPVIPYLIGILFGPALTRGLMGALTGSIGKGIVSALVSGGSKLIDMVVGKTKDVVEASKKVGDVGNATEGLKTTKSVGKAAGGAIKGSKDWGVQDAVKLGLKLVAIAGALALGGVMLAYAVGEMKKALDSAGVKSIKDAEAPLAVLVAMTVAAIPLMFALKLANQAGSIADVIKGGLVITAAVGIVGLVGAGLAYVMKQAGTPAELTAAGNLMLKMSLVFLAMVPLIFASMAIGALASGPQAIALGMAAVGLGVIGVAVGEMAGIAVGIVKTLAKLPIDNTFQTKVDAFLGIMKAIQTFTDSMVTVIGMLMPSVTDLLTGTSVTKKVEKAQAFIAELIGNKGGGGIIGIIKLVMGVVDQIEQGGSAFASSAGVFADIMRATAEVMKGLTPPPEFFEAQTSFINVVAPWTGAKVGKRASEYMSSMVDSLKMLIPGITDAITTISNINIPNVEQAKAVAQLITAISSLTKTLTPDPKAIEALNESTTSISYGWGLFKTKADPKSGDKLKEIMKAQADAAISAIGAITSGPVTKAIDAVKGFSKEQIEGVKFLSDILGTISGLIAAVGTNMKSTSTTKIDGGKTEMIFESVPTLTSVLEGIGKELPNLMSAMAKAVTSVPTDKAFMQHLETAKSLFSMLTEIPKLAKGISDASKGAGGSGDINTEPLFKAVATIAMLFFNLATQKGYGTSRPVMIELVENIKLLGNSGLASAGPALSKTVSSFTSLFKSVAEFGDSFKSAVSSMTDVARAASTLGKSQEIEALSPETLKLKLDKVASFMTNLSSEKNSLSTISAASMSMKKYAESMKTDGIVPALEAVSEMVKAANKLDEALADTGANKIDIKARLGGIANAVGLGGRAQYTIQNKHANITVNMTVTMDAGEVEKVIFTRQGSFVRQRIDFLTENANAGPQILQGNPYTQAPGAPNPLGKNSK